MSFGGSPDDFLRRAVGRIHPQPPTTPGVPSFNADPRTVTVRTIDLSTARTNEELSLVGTTLWAVEASSLEAQVTLSFSREQDPIIPVRRGFGISGIPFDHIRIQNTAQSGQTITLLTFVEIVPTGARFENPPEQLTRPSTGSILADITVSTVAVEILAADPTRQVAFLNTDPGIADSAIRIGPETPTSTSGLLVQPGTNLTITYTGRLMAIRDSAATADATVSGFELAD